MLASKTEEERTTELLLKGALVTERAAEVKEELQKALREGDYLIINLEGTSEMDLSCIQLLCSAHRSAVALKKTLVLVGGPKVGISEWMGMATRGCPVPRDQKCIWAGE